ncbi:hypothetical protein [Allocoleopsis franciscana]|nr:hypothetical protein [Allocoleopsis franciscana]
MADYLKVVTSHLHSALVSAEAMSRLQSLTQILPPCSRTVLEVRLGANQPQVDFFTCYPCHTLNLPKNLLTHPIWQGIQNFCLECVDTTSLLHQNVKHIWLEFDLDKPPSQLPIPCIFFNALQETFSDAQALIEAALRIPNYQVSPKQQSNLQLCIDSLPSNARSDQVGAMLSRPNQPLRITVCGLLLQQVADYLRQIGWKDPTNTLSTIILTLSTFLDESDFLLLNLDIGDTIYPRIGLEFYPKQQPRLNRPELLFLNRLVEMDLSTLAKKNALLAWSGYSQKAEHPELWPENLTGGDLLLRSEAISLFQRTINHIKIVYQPGCLLEAKAYLGIIHDWFNVKS